MKNILLLIISSFLNAQPIVSAIINYQIQNNDHIGKGTLYVNDNKSYYIIDSIYFGKLGNTKITDEAQHQVKIIEAPEFIRKTVYFKTLDSNQMIYEEYLENKKHTILDELPEIKWQIKSNQDKMIGDYKCNRAEAKYRGNTIYAYFTDKIPFNAGPFKISGLPGIILELGELNSNYNHYIAQFIRLNSFDGLNLKPYTFDKSTIPLKDFVRKKLDYVIKVNKARDAMLIADFPDAGISETQYYRPGIEKYYLWEDPNNTILSKY